MKLTGSRNQCATCLEHFNSTVAFDRHRTGHYASTQRQCLSPNEMRAHGMVLNGAGFWITENNQILARTSRVETAIGSTPCPGSHSGDRRSGSNFSKRVAEVES